MKTEPPEAAAVAVPLDAPVGPGAMDKMHADLAAAVTVDWAIEAEKRWRNGLEDPRNFTASQIALLKLSQEVERLRFFLKQTNDFGPCLLAEIESLRAAGIGPNNVFSGARAAGG